MKENIKNIFFRIWYWYLSTIDKNAEIIFMNYGYSKDNHRIKLDESDEENRYSVQLYHFVANGAAINGKAVLEVGCGRGGGLSYITRYLSPKSATGVDLNKKAIEFCEKHYADETIDFLQANAQNLSFEDNTFDVVINIESAHRYTQIDAFIYEVYRVLKPGGFFLFADFGNETELKKLNIQFKKSNFQFVKEEVITRNVVEALELGTQDRQDLIKKLIPKILQGLGRNFAATVGSPTYNKFKTREFEYVFYVLTR